MTPPATVITPWDYIPVVTLCLSVAALYLTSVVASFSKANWVTSRGYRIFLFALAPILVTMLVAVFGSRMSRYQSYRISKAGDEARRLENGVFVYFQAHENKFPDGNNREIMKVLIGADENATFIQKNTILSINNKGEVVDPWGTPYHFSLIPDKELRVISAGPDKVLGTNDDLPKHKES
ncbi:MAG: hypothetical protein NTW21_15615 [Verrucomicrobia bacterium]|nr:hypothetical protein [Verrucomicrobiota bacterium]